MKEQGKAREQLPLQEAFKAVGKERPCKIPRFTYSLIYFEEQVRGDQSGCEARVKTCVKNAIKWHAKERFLQYMCLCILCVYLSPYMFLRMCMYTVTGKDQ